MVIFISANLDKCVECRSCRTYVEMMGDHRSSPNFVYQNELYPEINLVVGAVVVMTNFHSTCRGTPFTNVTLTDASPQSLQKLCK